MKHLLIVLISMIILLSCSKPIDEDSMVVRDGIVYQQDSQKPYTGKTFTLHGNGQKASDGTWANGVIDGKWTIWFENGQRSREGIWTNRVRDGKWNTWYEDGQSELEIIFKDGEKNGIAKRWYTNGILAEESNYLSDELVGPTRKWSFEGREILEERVSMDTNYGTIVIDLFEAETPIHASNFKKLCNEGAFDGIYFHRIIPGFVVQGGDPNTRENSDRQDDGDGGIGEKLPAEIGQPHLRGAIGAARDNNLRKQSNGSQFYICLTAQPQLDEDYTIFGRVLNGMEVVDRMATVETDTKDNPIDPVTINRTEFKYVNLLTNKGVELTQTQGIRLRK